MRIHLISPTHHLRDGTLHETTRYWTSGITLPWPRALTPARHEVAFTHELMADLDADRIAREAESVWAALLADLEQGRSNGIYRARRWHDLRELPKMIS